MSNNIYTGPKARKTMEARREAAKDTYDILSKSPEEIVNDIVSECKYNEFGARRLDKIIGSKVENKIIDAIMNKDNDVVIVAFGRSIETNHFIFRILVIILGYLTPGAVVFVPEFENHFAIASLTSLSHLGKSKF